ncbi:MAG: hypothetical protein U9O54_02135, partial [Chloroflexota bacterium]|nr:hypothetical protein [Chloroflexota bacterium]
METLSQYQISPSIDKVGLRGLVEHVDLYCADIYRNLDSEHRSQMGQFFTPPPVAQFMSSLFGDS